MLICCAQKTTTLLWGKSQWIWLKLSVFPRKCNSLAGDCPKLNMMTQIKFWSKKSSMMKWWVILCKVAVVEQRATNPTGPEGAFLRTLSIACCPLKYLLRIPLQVSLGARTLRTGVLSKRISKTTTLSTRWTTEDTKANNSKTLRKLRSLGWSTTPSSIKFQVFKWTRCSRSLPKTLQLTIS